MIRTPLRRPGLAALVPFTLVVGVVAAVVLGVGFGTDGATAIRVGDTKISRELVNDEMRVVFDFQSGQYRSGKAAVTADVSAAIATQLVFAELADRYLARADERVTAADRATAREQTRGAEFRSTPEWFQERYIARFSALAALTRLTDDDADEVLRLIRREARRAGVRVDPAYGRWVAARGQVVPVQVPSGLANGS
jgi:hypothetical protein